MIDDDPGNTRRDMAITVPAELEAAGFDDPQEIGRGGFGIVFRCTQHALDRAVAVKVSTAVLDEENRERFLREQRAMGRLTGHPNIVTALQVGATDSGRPFIVMQYYPGDSIDAWVRRHGPLPLEEALRLGVKLAGALETAHRLQIMHRDVKPANILITDYGEPALTDFGIAHISGGFVTATGVVTGSPAYTAPEVLAGQPPSPAADVYGLGATLFAVITGHAAFERRSGEQVFAQFLRITTDPAPDLRVHGIPDDVSAVVQRSMSGEPEDRPTAAELGEELRNAQLRHGFAVEEMAVRVSLGDERPKAERSFSASRAPASLGARNTPGNLPLELTSFIGRRSQLAEAKQLLTAARLVTLTGVGGVGKTRLALRAAASVERGFADGVWLVELDKLHDESLLADVLAATLGLRNHSAQPMKDLLLRYLAPRQTLLVLDNCEQVVDVVAKLAETLLRTCPEIRILATSREPLDIGGEAVLRIAPLSVPDLHRGTSLQGLPRYDAVTLFAERAAATVPTFELTEDNQETVARICHGLDGIPLSIELAAARLRAMSPEQILQRLIDRYTLLTRGHRDAPTRQQSLRWCIDWSYDLCTEQEQQAWAWLSVFADSFELDAAEGICGGDDLGSVTLVDVLTGLVDKSVLIREESGRAVRYRLLETLREYGRERLRESGESDELRRRHVNWYMSLSARAWREWISPQQPAWIARLDREQPNLREAMEFCLNNPDPTNIGLRIANALGSFWNCRGIFGEGRHWLERLLDHHGSQPTEEQALALHTASMLAALQGDLPSATAALADLDAITTSIGVPEIDLLRSFTAAFVALYSGDLTRAIEHFETSSAESRTQGDLHRHLASLVGLALSCALHDEPTRVSPLHQQVLALAEPLGECIFRSYSLWVNGLVTWQQGAASTGAESVRQGLRLNRLTGDLRGTAWCMQTLAWIAADMHQPRRAAVLMGAAATLRETMGSPTVSFPDMASYQHEAERQVRKSLGARVFDSEIRHGAAATFEDATAYALGEQPPDKASDSAAPALTRREQQVADLVAQGMTNREIAAKLVISQRTAQGHVEHILAKLGFTSRAQIAAWVVEQISHQ
ncbi:protein kinase [Rhodococcus sp. IEGM 1307]|uniref:protein kinase domain-containing protein n=1 Tax=Rhodococcus sp. IEGM 1307 TaxID=3047091 RepID=UPI0024B7C1CE|nr:protein kinase [Rhodococcus sp. IEGM 1307]MDI9979420.1 protein kinase [Rhodococcus sp. IEGM 1307]